MNVKQLINLLEKFDEDQEVVIQDSGMGYVSSISWSAEEAGVRSFFGDDFDAVHLHVGTQLGMGGCDLFEDEEWDDEEDEEDE